MKISPLTTDATVMPAEITQGRRYGWSLNIGVVPNEFGKLIAGSAKLPLSSISHFFGFRIKAQKYTPNNRSDDTP
jgi:hypothetical protein